MKTSSLIIFSMMIVFVVLPNPGLADEMNPVRNNTESWTSYDHSVSFSQNNPEWGIVLVGNNKNFNGLSTFANYQFNETDLILHDARYNITYVSLIWKYENNGNFYHFYEKEEIPPRNRAFTTDNKEDYLSK